MTSVLAEDPALRDVTGLSTPHDGTDLVGSAPRRGRPQTTSLSRSTVVKGRVITGGAAWILVLPWCHATRTRLPLSRRPGTPKTTIRTRVGRGPGASKHGVLDHLLADGSVQVSEPTELKAEAARTAAHGNLRTKKPTQGETLKVRLPQ